MQHRFIALVTLILVSGYVTAAQSLPPAFEWLQRMNQAVFNFNYEGHFVYLSDNTLEAMRIRHQVTDGVVQEHLISLNGAAREVIRDKSNITIIQPQGGKVRIHQHNVSGRVSSMLPVYTPELISFYRFVLGEDTRVAGRYGKVIALEPRDNLRYGYRFTLDKGTALPLDITVVDDRGQMISRIMFTDINVISISESMPEQFSGTDDGQESSPVLEKTTTDVQQDPGTQLQESLAKSAWTFAAKPVGFEVENYQYKSKTRDRDTVEHFVLSDGLSTISVYIERYIENNGLQGVSSLGAMNAVGKQVQNHQVTIVGEVPVYTLQMIANGIRQKSR